MKKKKQQATPFQLDLRDTEAERMSLFLYTEERKEVHARFLGLSESIRPPVNSLIGKLMLYLQNLPAVATTEQGRIFWASSSFEAWMGMHWLIRKEWINSYKFPDILKGAAGIAKAKRDAEPMGDLLLSLLHLCEKSATVAHFGNYPEYIGGARLFSAIVVEIAHYGGVANLLRLVYPVQKTLLAKKKEGQSKKILCRDLSAIVTQIYQMKTPDRNELFLSQLIAHAVSRASQSDLYKKTVFKSFITALRAYVKHTDSKECGLVTFDADQNWLLSMGKSKGYKKLVSEPLVPQGVQMSVANFSNSG